jgi:deazaflavin-dependent oxidoreductase (nitroreductase family)
VAEWEDYNQQIIAEFRANDGRVGGPFANSTLVLLHTTGAKSGLERINPLASLEDGDRLVVIASKGGAPSNPDWYYNVLANPDVTVEYGTETFDARAAVAKEPERSQLYAKMAAKSPTFAEYERKTSRTIPVVILTRKDTQ